MPNSLLKLRKTLPEQLRAMGLDEVWLQNQVLQDPSLLGLGDLVVVQREKTQPSGGRIDFVMKDPGNDTRYEIELMLGSVNESHIIRTIEYWDVERQRYPLYEHRAVIVAEEITTRFFNVIRLLNRSIPLMAIQLSGFRFEGEVVLQFTTVLDTYEFGGESEEDEVGSEADRAYWEKRSNAESLDVVDVIKALTPTVSGEPRITYNQNEIALATNGYNFCWFYPRKVATHCYVQIKVGAENRQDIIEKLGRAGIEAENEGRNLIRLHLKAKDVAEHKDIVSDVIRVADGWSRR